MNNDSEKEKEIEEIKRRIDYLVNTDEISISDKIAIAKKALQVIEDNETEKAVQWIHNNKQF